MIQNNPEYNSVAIRFGQIGAAIHVWHESPVFGFGMRFYNLPQYISVTPPPNSLVDNLASTGMVGSLAFVFLVVVTMRSMNALPRIYGTLGLVILLGHYVDGLFDTFWIGGLTIPPMVIAGISIGMADADPDRERVPDLLAEQERSRHPRHRPRGPQSPPRRRPRLSHAGAAAVYRSSSYLPMDRAMRGPEHDPSSGVLSARTRGQEGHRRVTCPSGGPSAVDLLSRPLHPAGLLDLGHAVRPLRPTGPYAAVPDLWHPTVAVPADDVEVVVDPRWLDDLDDPNLIISAGYVGPDRRRSPRDEGATALDGRRRAAILRRGVQVLAMTALAVMSLALIASHSAPPAAHTPSAATTATAPASATGRPVTGHSSRATIRQGARTEAAAQRALARHRSTPAATTAPGSAVAPATATDALRSAQAAGAAVVAWIRTSAREQSAAARSAQRTAAAQRRAAASAARAERHGARRPAGSRRRTATPTTPSEASAMTIPGPTGGGTPGPSVIS